MRININQIIQEPATKKQKECIESINNFLVNQSEYIPHELIKKYKPLTTIKTKLDATEYISNFEKMCREHQDNFVAYKTFNKSWLYNAVGTMFNEQDEFGDGFEDWITEYPSIHCSDDM